MRIACITAGLFAVSLATAATPIDGVYTSIFGGYAYLPNNISVTSFGVTRTDANYHSGFNAGGSIGYKSNPLRYEGEFNYLRTDLRDFKLNGVRQNWVNGYSDDFFLMANVYYDFPQFLATLEPFLGVGLGYGSVRAKLNSLEPLTTSQYTGTNSVFAYQGLAGLTYNFAENYALNLGYRYIASERASNLGKVFQAHLANVGVVYRFNLKRYQ